MQPQDDLARGVEELSRLLLSRESMESTLQRVASLGPRTLKGCDHAGVTMIEEAMPQATATTGETAASVEEIQYRYNEGPCLQAVNDGNTYLIPDMAHETRWPRFAREATAKGMGSSLSVPLRIEGEVLGALNLYSERVDAFDPEDCSIAASLAAQAGVAVANARIHARTQRLVDNLNRALETRGTIERAKGMLMTRENVGEEEAFGMLRSASQNTHVKLRDIAQQVVQSAEEGPEGRRP
jgi:transcriptional regulator with GAF, ATPase, and Fis domain